METITITADQTGEGLPGWEENGRNNEEKKRWWSGTALKD
jgi:hypothetical protein